MAQSSRLAGQAGDGCRAGHATSRSSRRGNSKLSGAGAGVEVQPQIVAVDRLRSRERVLERLGLDCIANTDIRCTSATMKYGTLRAAFQTEKIDSSVRSVRWPDQKTAITNKKSTARVARLRHVPRRRRPGQYKDYILVMLFLKYISRPLEGPYRRATSKQFGDDEERIRARAWSASASCCRRQCELLTTSTRRRNARRPTSAS